MYTAKQAYTLIEVEPQWEHDCDQCVFLGHCDMSYHLGQPVDTTLGDLYVCYDRENFKVKSLISRLGKDGDYYTFQQSKAVCMYAAHLAGIEVDPYYLPAIQIVARSTYVFPWIQYRVEPEELSRIFSKEKHG